MSDDCKDISNALKTLSGKIDESNRCCRDNAKKIADLDKRLRDLEKNGSTKLNNKNSDLADILRRLAKLEKDDTIISGVVADVIDDVKHILDALNEHNNNAKENANTLDKILSLFSEEE